MKNKDIIAKPLYFRVTLNKTMRGVDWVEFSGTIESFIEKMESETTWSIQQDGFEVGAEEILENPHQVFDIIDKNGKAIGEIQMEKPIEDVPRSRPKKAKTEAKTTTNDNKMAGKKKKQETGLQPISPEREAAIEAANAATKAAAEPPAPPEPPKPEPLVIVPVALGKRELFAGVTVTATGLTFSEKPTLHTVAGTLQFFANVDNLSKWALGDAIEKASEYYSPEEIEQACTAAGVNFKTLRNNLSVTRGVPPENRREDLSFTHHAEVCSLDHVEQKEWLAKAAENKWSCSDLRLAIATSKATPLQGTEIPKTPAPKPEAPIEPQAPSTPAPEPIEPAGANTQHKEMEGAKQIEVQVIPPSPQAGTAPKPTPNPVSGKKAYDPIVEVEDDNAQNSMQQVIAHLNWGRFSELSDQRKLDWKKMAVDFAEAIKTAGLASVS